MAEIEGQVRDEELDPEREARRRIALAQIRQYPDAALKMQARPVQEFDDELRDLVERMKRLMEDANGIGLAATQVGVLRRLFVFLPAPDEVAVVVNPEIVERGEETDVADEGCLSIQGVLVPVERATTVTVAGLDENGDEVRYELEDVYARAAQHESDHLDGILMIDRTTPEARREALALLRPRIVLG
jgi:peptide deformylase